MALGKEPNRKTPLDIEVEKIKDRSDEDTPTKIEDVKESREPGTETAFDFEEYKEEVGDDDTLIMTDVWQVYGRHMEEESKRRNKTSLEFEEVEFTEKKDGNKNVTFMLGETEDMANNNEQKSKPPNETDRQNWEGGKSTWAVKKSVPFMVPGLA